MATATRALSIRQPYAELVLRGEKTREYRSTLTSIRGRVLIYASLKPADDPASWDEVGRVAGSLPAGVIVGSVEIVDCRFDGRSVAYAFVLKNPRRVRPYWKPTSASILVSTAVGIAVSNRRFR
jgi:hypothetical protein